MINITYKIVLYRGKVHHNLIHELNHVYEFNLLEVNDNGYLAVTGWDRLNCNINGEESDEIREYELFNEIINEMISQEITEILFNRKQYIFNDQSNAKYSGGTSYERTKFIIKEFFIIFSNSSRYFLSYSFRSSL